MDRKRIYIAGPLNASAVKYIANFHKMCAIAELIRGKGFSVYVPCLDFLMGFLSGEYKYEDYFENSQPWLLASDAVFLCPGWRESDGCKKEFLLAGKNNIPTFETLVALVDYFKENNYG